MKSSRYLVPDGTYMADPAAHVFNGKLFIYPSHDIESGIPENDNGDHFDMRDYHVFSLAEIGGKVTDHGVALDLKDAGDKDIARRIVARCDVLLENFRPGVIDRLGLGAK